MLGVLAVQLGWTWLLRGPAILNSNALLIGGHLGASTALLGLMVLLATTPADAIRLHRRTSNAIIIGGALLLHMANLWLVWPALSDDVVRYRLEGRMWVAGVSPYATPPEEFFAHQPDAADAIDRLVFAPTMATIYPPVAQALFVTGRAFEDVLLGPFDVPLEATHWRTALDDLSWARRALVQRALAAALALGATLLLLRLLAVSNRSAWWAVLFAWHPLTITETAGMAHVDILGAVLLLGMLLLSHHRQFVAAAMLLGLAAAVKPQVVVLLPFIGRDAMRAGRRWWLVPLVTVGVMLPLYGAALLYQHGYAGWHATAERYAVHWEANGSVYELLKLGIGRGDDHRIVFAKALARTLPPAAIVIGMVWLWWRRASTAEAGYWLHLVPLLLAPVVYPWYLLWMLCFVPLISSRQAIVGMVWGGTVVISYVLWHQQRWTMPLWAAAAEYLPVYAALFAVAIMAMRRRPQVPSPRGS